MLLLMMMLTIMLIMLITMAIMLMIMLLLMLLLVVVSGAALRTRAVAVVADPLRAVADEPPRLHLMMTTTGTILAPRHFRRVLV